MPTVEYEVQIKQGASWVTLPAGSVVEIEGDDEAGGSPDNPFAFGESPNTRRTVRTKRPITGFSTWPRTPIKTRTIIDGISAKTFTGIITGYSGNDHGDMTWECEALMSEISVRLRDVYSPPFEQRAVATATTASSVENPALAGYSAGPINYGLWMAGGRPLQQAASYPNADFYYSCEHAIIAPDVAWFAGEDGWQVMLQLAQASGGQLYQDFEGTIRYRNVLNLGRSTSGPTFTFAGRLQDATDFYGVYKQLSDQGATEQYATKFVASFTPRALGPMQEIVHDTTPRQIDAGTTRQIVIEPQWPFTNLELVNGSLAANKINLALLLGAALPQGVGGYSHTITADAQRLTLSITNNAAGPAMLFLISVNAQPWLAGETGRVEVGSGTVKRDVVDNVFVQYEEQALQLANMALAFYGTPHPIYTIEGLPFDTRRYLGEVVYLIDQDLVLDELCVIVGRNVKSIEEVDYVLAAVGDTPVIANFFEVGTQTYNGLSRNLAW